MPPPKTPTHLRAVKGFPDKRPVNHDEPMPKNGFHQPPEYFTDEEKGWYMDMCQELNRWGVITELDSRAAEMLTVAYSEFRVARREVEANGSLTYIELGAQGQEKLKPHPAVGIADAAWKKFRAMATEFGMTPASRSKVNSVKKEEDTSATDDLLNRKRK